MHCPPLEIPEELVEALQNDELAIFAGAGISRDVGIPTFFGLSDAIRSELSGPDRNGRAPDEYLDELDRQGYRVHETCAKIIQKFTTPGDYHTSLLGLFSNPKLSR